MDGIDKPHCLADEVSAFRQEVSEEIAREETLLKRVNEPPFNHKVGHALVLLAITVGVVMIFMDPERLWDWLFVGLLLYSYNFLILLIPTTTREKKGLSDRIDIDRRWKELKELTRHLISKRKRLAVEIGLTVFLGGMVPLASGFAVIFGIGLIFTMFFGFILPTIDQHIASAVVTQILLIMLFYVLMLVLEPHAQGFTRIAGSLRSRLGKAQASGLVALTLIVMLIAAWVAVSTIVFIGAILLPGGTLLNIYDAEEEGGIDLQILLIVLIIQLIIMRHLQGISSRWMARNLLKDRIEKLKNRVLKQLGEYMTMRDGLDDESNGSRLESIKTEYRAIVIYDVVEQNFFGLASIFLVAPRLRYALDDTVLACLNRSMR